MIPQAHIIEWQHIAPWVNDDQIEQDLLISRIIVDLYNDEFLNKHLIFRGGTTLNKLFFNEPVRYSEDIDLVQIIEGPIKPIVETIQKTIDPWLGKSTTESRRNGFRIYYSFTPESDPEGKKRIKIEINTREHFSVFPIEKIDFKVESQWFTDNSVIRTYNLNEQLGTKLRALYQRKKGRDLFDLFWAIKVCNGIDNDKIVKSFKAYINFQGNKVSQRQFLLNVDEKMEDYTFIHDMDPLKRVDIDYDPQIAIKQVKQLIKLL